MDTNTKPRCIYCGSRRTRRNGKRLTAGGPRRQTWQCKRCGRGWTEAKAKPA